MSSNSLDIVFHKAEVLNFGEAQLINSFFDGSCFGGMVSKMASPGFPGGAVVKNLPANAGDAGSSPGPERSHMPRSN